MRNYFLRFGNGNPASFSGLSPTFLVFMNGSGATIAPPGITEILPSSGLYRFQYYATQTIAFTADGSTSGIDDSLRYVCGTLDPVDLLADQIGSTNSSFGATSIDPGTVFGFLKRAQEMLEGDSIYTKSSGVLQYFNRGQTTLLRSRTISDTATQTTKT